MIFLFGITGLIFLLCCFIFIRIRMNVIIDKQEKGLVCIAQAFLYFIPDHKLLEYRYESLDFKLLMAFDKAKTTTSRLEKRSKSHDFKAYLIRFGFHDYKYLLKTIMNYTIVEEIDWKTNIGLQDAMYTGIGTGNLWAFKGILVSLLSLNSRLEKLHLKINPEFNEQIFRSNLSCIIKMRIVHIIFIAVYLLFLIVRGYFNGYRPGKAQPSHRRAYENGYAKY